MSEVTNHDIYHAWFSQTQKEILERIEERKKGPISNIYLSLDGIENEITEVSKKMSNHNERFSDSQYLGKVSKWIRSIYQYQNTNYQ